MRITLPAHSRPRPPVAVLALAGLFAAPAMLAQAPGGCAGNPRCAEAREFTATVTSFRTSTIDSATRAIAATVRFQNKGTGALVLGYVRESGVVTDDRGNRYVVPETGGVRGIGEIAGAEVDAKFALAAGESGDARFELVLKLAKPDQPLGDAFELDLAVREIGPGDGGAPRLGREHALHFAGLGSASTAAGDEAPAEPAAPPDPCAGKRHCFAAEPFTAEITRVTPTQGGRHHVVTLNVRIRNISSEPIILGYRSGSSNAVDEYGNQYAFGRPGTHDTSVRGIGIVTGRQADPQFALRPGQAREATFTVIRFNARPPIGARFTYNVALDQLEILPGNGVRMLNQYAVSVGDLTAGAAGAAQKVLDALRKKP